MSTLANTRMQSSSRAPGAEVALQADDRLTELAATMAMAVAANLSIGLAPFIVNALSAHAGITPTQAGLCISAEMLGSVVGVVALLVCTFKVRRRPVAVVSLLLLAGGNLLCLLASSFPTFLAARFIAGIGSGLTTFTYALLATTRHPERNFAILSAATIASTAACIAIAPWLSAHLGADSLFAFIALPATLALPGIRWIADSSSTPVADRVTSGSAPPRRRLAPVIGIAMMLLYFTPLSAFWAYVARVGVAREANPTAVAAVVSTGLFFAGFAGCFPAMLSVLRQKRRFIIGLATLGGAASIVVSCLSPNFSIYAAAVSVFIFLWYLAMPFLMGVLSAIDASGRLALGGILIETVGFVLGPAIGGPFIERQLYLPFSVACAAMFGASLLCALMVAPPSIRASSTPGVMSTQEGC